MKRISLYSVHALAFAAMFLSFSSCKEKDVYNPQYVAELKAQLPDFSMKNEANVNIDFGPQSAGASISIYAENPLQTTIDSKGNVSEKVVGEPLFSLVLDSNGRYQGEIQLPTADTHLFIYSSDWMAPRLTEATVVDGLLNCFLYNEGSERSKVKRRVVADANLQEIHLSDTRGRITSIVGGWDRYGKATDPNQLYGVGAYTTDLVKAIQNTLLNSDGGKKDNTGLITTTDVVNTSIAKSYQNADGSISTVDDAEITFTFITENGWYSSSLGYYYYPIGEAPANPDMLEKFIIAPNVSIAGNNSFQKNKPAPDMLTSTDAAMSTNRSIRLLFRDPSTGKLTSKFPGGYTIGYFLIPDAYRENDAATTWTSKTVRVRNTGSYALTQQKTTKQTPCSKCGGKGILWYRTCTNCGGTGKVSAVDSYSYTYIDEKNNTQTVAAFYDAAGQRVEIVDNSNPSQYYYDRIVYTATTNNTNGINYSNGWIYSDSEWNSNKSRFISLTDNNTREVVYGVEDGGDNSFEDVLFTISCSPNTAIYNPSRPTIREDGTLEKPIQSVDHGYYLFEDIWSSGGDYDMNDVIVEYKYTENLRNITTYTKETNTGNGSTTTTTTSSETYLDNVTISIVPRHCGATYQDGFSLQLPEYFSINRDNIESIQVNGGDNLLNRNYWKNLNASNTDINGNTIDLSTFAPRFTYEFFTDIKEQEESKGYVMIVRFKDKAVTSDMWEATKHHGASADEHRLRWNYNPYLKVYDLSLPGFSTNTGNSILEIHLPLYPYTSEGIPTAGGASSGTGTFDWNLWFVAAVSAGVDGNLQGSSAFYPFAMDIPYYEGFYPSREMTRISDSYPQFFRWQFGGSSDWYKHRAPNRTQPFTLKRENWIFFDYTTQNDYDK